MNIQKGMEIWKSVRDKGLFINEIAEILKLFGFEHAAAELQISNFPDGPYWKFGCTLNYPCVHPNYDGTEYNKHPWLYCQVLDEKYIDWTDQGWEKAA